MKLFNTIKRFISSHIVKDIYYTLEGNYIKKTTIYLDNSSNFKYYKGSCTVWYITNAQRLPIRRCNIIIEEELFKIWKKLKSKNNYEKY